MSLLRDLRLRFSPPRISDPEFGKLLFMYIPRAPEKSYWECEWSFPNTGDIISIGLPGDEHGPLTESRRFFLALTARFDEILQLARPKLQQVFRVWLDQELPDNLFSALKLAGFGVEDPRSPTPNWDVMFETKGQKWLGITVPFIGDEAQDAVVDT